MSFERAKESAIYVLAGLLNDIAEGFYKTSIIPCLVGISTNQGYFVLQSVLEHFTQNVFGHLGLLGLAGEEGEWRVGRVCG